MFYFFFILIYLFAMCFEFQYSHIQYASEARDGTSPTLINSDTKQFLWTYFWL